jgi:integrase
LSKKRKLWRYTAGRRPHSVTVEELEPGGNLYARIWIPARQDNQYRSLRHKDRKRAMQQADELALKRQLGHQAPLPERVTLSRLLRLYMKHRSPLKGDEAQGEDRRREKLFSRFLGPSMNPRTLSLAQWESFITLRRSGAIDGRGDPVPDVDRRPVGDRTVQADLIWLKAVVGWGTKWRAEGGGYLLPENPARGFPLPRERNPRRPVASLERIEAIREVAPQVLMRVLRDGKHIDVPSHLNEIFDIVVGTGRRITAVLRLRYADLRLNEGPFGSILWPAETSKSGFESLVPLSPDVRAAIDRVMDDRPGIGGAYMFPGPKRPGDPCRYEVARSWLLEAERLAEVPKMDGSLWHAYRRAWATQRKNLPLADVALAGGWKDATTVARVYQQPDPATLLRVVLEGSEEKAG